jgi:hypothetical protein
MGGDSKKKDGKTWQKQLVEATNSQNSEKANTQDREKAKTTEDEKRSIFATEEGSAGVAVATGQTNKKRTLFGN